MNKNLRDNLDEWLASKFDGVHTAIPGRIQSYSGHAERRATVIPTVRPWLSCGAVVEIQPIQDVPVIMPGADGMGMVFPIKAGSGVLLIFTEAGIGSYLQGRGTGTTDADDPTRFSLHDCVAIAGLWPFSSCPATGVPEDALGIFMGSSKIIMTESSVTINDNLEVLR